MKNWQREGDAHREKDAGEGHRLERGFDRLQTISALLTTAVDFSWSAARFSDLYQTYHPLDPLTAGLDGKKYPNHDEIQLPPALQTHDYNEDKRNVEADASCTDVLWR
jgi:hypothetical protein